jgi:hypothetical protein
MRDLLLKLGKRTSELQLVEKLVAQYEDAGRLCTHLVLDNIQ